MAKKMLINADMLLATPRRSEPVDLNIRKEESPMIPTEPVIPPLSIQQEKEEVPTVVSIEKQPQIPIIQEEKKQAEITSVQKGLKAGETRATFIVKEAALEKIKAIAYWDRENIKDVVQTALEEYIARYETAKGNIAPIP